MLSHNRQKYINSLKLKKYRQQHGAFIVEGEKCVTELLNSNMETICVYAIGEWIERNASSIHNKKTEIQEITENELKKISDLSTPNQVIAVAKMPNEQLSIDTSQMILALDNIKDPGNLGTMARTADWFGITQIICSQNSVDFYNPKAIQATMGSFSRINIKYTNLDEFFSKNKDIPVYGALLEGPSLANTKFLRSGIILIGSESHGISRNLIDFVNTPIHIPHFTSNSSQTLAESLNASIANAIICYEICKQLNENKVFK